MKEYNLKHYSRERRKVIDPAFAGTGQAGAERHRAGVPKSFWYDASRQAEARFVGLVEHRVTVTLNLYDLATDDACIIQHIREVWKRGTVGCFGEVLENELVVTGYHGYYDSENRPGVYAVFYPIDVETGRVL